MSTAVDPSLSTTAVRPRDTLLQLARNERQFLFLIGVALVAAGAAYPVPEVARWLGFALAAYSAIANDSIQTVGVFIASNKARPWWLLWLFIGGVFLATAAYGWATMGGDVSYGRLASKGFATAPASFTFLQVAAPIILLLVTRLRMPVSTTFLLLSCFATDPGTVGDVLTKSLWGYVVAFATAVVAWAVVGRLMRRVEQTPMHPAWYPAQWLATGDRIQRVVDEKSSVEDIRSATVIDLVYAVILFGFKEASTIPMSTTWVFIGLLAGRELVLALRGASDRPLREGLKLAGRDVAYCTAGLVISVVLALAANPAFRAGLFE